MISKGLAICLGCVCDTTSGRPVTLQVQVRPPSAGTPPGRLPGDPSRSSHRSSSVSRTGSWPLFRFSLGVYSSLLRVSEIFSILSAATSNQRRPASRPRDPSSSTRLGSRRLEITFTWLSATQLSLAHRQHATATAAAAPTHALSRAHTHRCMPEPFTGMTDSATHHSMDQELKQFALGGFPGSPRRLLRSHLLSPLRSPGCVSPLLLLSFPLPPVPLPCSTFLFFVLSFSALPVPDSPSPSFEREAAPPSPSLCLAHFLVEPDFRSPARRSEVGTAEGVAAARWGSVRGDSASPP